jgi:RNA polymerase sigma factor (sigma-70 family)
VSDERLVARVRAGDTRAFEEIYDRYGLSIRSFCRHLLGQADDADDAVQHTFLAAYRGIRSGAQAIDLKPWLFAIARNRCVSLLRAGRHDSSTLGDAPEPATEGLSAEVERRESLRDLLRDIGGLPEDQRAALVLTRLGTLRHDEVARVLEVPAEKVKALVFQARSSLVSNRLARETACHDIREQLATLTGPALRRGNLRRHLVDCSGCQDFQRALKRQRAAIALILPVAAQPAVRSKLLAEIGGGASGAGGGSGAGGALGGLAAKGAAVKVGIAVTLAAGAGVVSLSTQVRRALGDPGPAPPKVARGGTANAGVVSGGTAAVGTHIAQRPGGSAGGNRMHYLFTMRRPGRGHRRDGSFRSDGPASGKNQAAPADQHTTGQTGASSGGNGPTGAPPGQPRAGGGPPGQAKKWGGPPGLAKKGGSPPGQAKKNGSPPGQAKKNGSASGQTKTDGTPPGQAKKNPPATATPPATPAPAPPGNGNGGNGNGNGGGNGNGNAGGSGNGNAGGNGKGGGSGDGRG